MLEMTYILKGSVAIGFQINKRKRYKIAIGPGKIMGEYNVQFLKDSLHIYICSEPIYGYAISRKAWRDMIDESDSERFDSFI